MSDRDEVRRVAEELCEHWTGTKAPGTVLHVEDRLIAFLAQREAAQEPTPVDRDVALRFIYARADILARGMGQAARRGLALDIADLLAQARREGREEGIEAAVKELRMLGNSRGAAQLNVRLINQTAPDGAKE